MDKVTVIVKTNLLSVLSAYEVMKRAEKSGAARSSKGSSDLVQNLVQQGSVQADVEYCSNNQGEPRGRARGNTTSPQCCQILFS